MQFQGAVVKEQGVTFAVLIVQRFVLDSTTEIAKAIAFGTTTFGDIPIVVMSQDARGVPTYKGRRDIVDFLAKLDLDQIPWATYAI